MPMRPLATWSDWSGCERVEPQLHAGLDVPEEPPRDVGAEPEQRQADGDPRRALGGDVEHGDEQPEEQQRRAEVLLEDEDEEAEDPGDEDRPEVATAREGEAEHLATGEREGVAGLHEVAGEEDGQDDLGDLTGLEGERPQADPDARAVDGAADARQQRQDQQAEADDRRGEGVAPQHAVVAQEEQHARGDRHGHGTPRELAQREALGDARAPRRGRGGRSSPGPAR